MIFSQPIRESLIQARYLVPAFVSSKSSPVLFTSRPSTTDWFCVTIYSDSYSAAFSIERESCLEFRVIRAVMAERTIGRDAGICWYCWGLNWQRTDGKPMSNIAIWSVLHTQKRAGYLVYILRRPEGGIAHVPYVCWVM